MTKRTRLLIGALLAAGHLALVSSDASAQDGTQNRARARSLVYRARADRGAGALGPALDGFKEAHALMDVPTTALELAETQVRVGQLVEARATATASLRQPVRRGEPAAFARARKELVRLVAAVSPRIPTIAIALPADEPFQVALDGASIEAASCTPGAPLPVNPGTHQVLVTVRGVKQLREVELAEGAHEVLTLAASAPTPPPASAPAQPTTLLAATLPPRQTLAPGAHHRSPLVYVGAGAAIAGIATGTVTGLMALDVRSSVDDRCGPSCADDVERGKTLGTVSTAAFAFAAAGVALTVYGLLSRGESGSGTASGGRVGAVAQAAGSGLRF